MSSKKSSKGSTPVSGKQAANNKLAQLEAAALPSEFGCDFDSSVDAAEPRYLLLSPLDMVALSLLPEDAALVVRAKSLQPIAVGNVWPTKKVDRGRLRVPLPDFFDNAAASVSTDSLATSLSPASPLKVMSPTRIIAPSSPAVLIRRFIGSDAAAIQPLPIVHVRRGTVRANTPLAGPGSSSSKLGRLPLTVLSQLLQGLVIPASGRTVSIDGFVPVDLVPEIVQRADARLAAGAGDNATEGGSGIDALPQQLGLPVSVSTADVAIAPGTYGYITAHTQFVEAKRSVLSPASIEAGLGSAPAHHQRLQLPLEMNQLSQAGTAPAGSLAQQPAPIPASAAASAPPSLIGGLQSQISQLEDLVSSALLHPDRYWKYGLRPPRGALLVGPPGTGA